MIKRYDYHSGPINGWQNFFFCYLCGELVIAETVVGQDLGTL